MSIPSSSSFVFAFTLLFLITCIAAQVPDDGSWTEASAQADLWIPSAPENSQQTWQDVGALPETLSWTDSYTQSQWQPQPSVWSEAIQSTPAYAGDVAESSVWTNPDAQSQSQQQWDGAAASPTLQQSSLDPSSVIETAVWADPSTASQWQPQTSALDGQYTPLDSGSATEPLTWTSPDSRSQWQPLSTSEAPQVPSAHGAGFAQTRASTTLDTQTLPQSSSVEEIASSAIESSDSEETKTELGSSVSSEPPVSSTEAVEDTDSSSEQGEEGDGPDTEDKAQYMSYLAGAATESYTGRDAACTKASQSWDDEYLTEDITAPPMSNLFAATPILSEIFPLRTTPLTLRGNPSTTNPNQCCGECSIYWPEVTLHYWPGKDANTACLADIAPDGASIGSQLGLFINDDQRTGLDASDPSVLPGLPIVSRRTVHSPLITPGPALPKRRNGHDDDDDDDDDDGNRGTITRNGHVFVSPSIYLEIPAVHASDACGPVGQRFTNVLWSYQPVDMYSVVPSRPDCWPALLGFDPVAASAAAGPIINNNNANNNNNNANNANAACTFSTRSFDFADLPCPPAARRAEGGSTFIYDPAVGYEPVLMQPWRMQHIDAAWARCKPNIGWDPYTALTSQEGGLLEPPRCPGHRKHCGRDVAGGGESGGEGEWEVPARTTGQAALETGAGPGALLELRPRTQVLLTGAALPEQTAGTTAVPFVAATGMAVGRLSSMWNVGSVGLCFLSVVALFVS